MRQAADRSATRDAADTAGRDSDFVQSLDRGLAVIRAFGPGRERLSLSDVARETGLTRAAARRFLLTLVKLGYVRSDGREFSLRPRVLELGYAWKSSSQRCGSRPRSRCLMAITSCTWRECLPSGS
jgi:IclR family transcriptional regulator, pca regulon regulatory protein